MSSLSLFITFHNLFTLLHISGNRLFRFLKFSFVPHFSCEMSFETFWKMCFTKFQKFSFNWFCRSVNTVSTEYLFNFWLLIGWSLGISVPTDYLHCSSLCFDFSFLLHILWSNLYCRVVVRYCSCKVIFDGCIFHILGFY